MITPYMKFNQNLRGRVLFQDFFGRSVVERPNWEKEAQRLASYSLVSQITRPKPATHWRILLHRHKGSEDRPKSENCRLNYYLFLVL